MSVRVLPPRTTLLKNKIKRNFEEIRKKQLLGITDDAEVGDEESQERALVGTNLAQIRVYKSRCIGRGVTLLTGAQATSKTRPGEVVGRFCSGPHKCFRVIHQ